MAEDMRAEKVLRMPKKKYLSTVDMETGEIVHEPLTERRGRRGFSLTFDAGADWLAEQNLSRAEYRILWKLIARLDFQNYINVSQKAIVESLGLQKSNVSKAFKGLLQRGIIVEGPTMNKVKSYRLNPDIAFKGTGKQQEKTVLDFNDLRKRREARKDTEE